MSQVDFCQRRVKLWVALLASSALLILLFAFSAASADGPDDNGGSTTVSSTRMQGPRAGVTPTTVTPGGSGPVVLVPPNHGPPTGRPVAFVPSFTAAVALIRPSVVNINAVRPRRWRRHGGGAGAAFIDPFDGVPDKIVGNMAFESVGSGVIVDSSGYVLTNNHIVAGASSIVVSRFGRKEHIIAQVVATAPHKDLALLKLRATGPFPAATFADSSKVAVGDWVLTVGNPFGLQHTVTSGIISGTRRSLRIGGVVYNGLLQTDAPINPGSSGGALTNIKGEVIGITTAIYAPTGVFSGAGFAIPSNQASAFVARALASRSKTTTPPLGHGTRTPPPMTRRPDRQAGGVHRAGVWIGIGAIDMTQALAKRLGYPHDDGAFISSVVSGSPAGKAGIKRGDVVTSISGRVVEGAEEIRRLVDELALGRSVSLMVWRNGKSKQLKMGPVAK